MMRSDIKERKDVIHLVDTFYNRVKENNTLNYIFEDVARVDWEKHLPIMYSFWSSILLGEQSYSGNPMEKHIVLGKKTALTAKEFSEWLFLFNSTVDELFEGPTATEAKLRAGNIARLMQHKVETA